MSNLKDVKAKAIKITLRDGVEREILFTLNAMAELEDRYGSVEAAFDALERNSFKAIRCVLWAGLLHTDEGLTEQQVGSLIDMTNIQDLMKAMNDAFDEDMPDAPTSQAGAIPNVVQPAVIK